MRVPGGQGRVKVGEGLLGVCELQVGQEQQLLWPPPPPTIRQKGYTGRNQPQLRRVVSQSYFKDQAS